MNPINLKVLKHIILMFIHVNVISLSKTYIHCTIQIILLSIKMPRRAE